MSSTSRAAASLALRYPVLMACSEGASAILQIVLLVAEAKEDATKPELTRNGRLVTRKEEAARA